MIVRLAGIAGLLHSLVAAAMASKEQIVLAPDNLADFVLPEASLPRLAELLTLEGRASIFYSYARETAMSALFTQSVSEGEGTTVFVPTNKAVQALARKPHEGPEGSVVGDTGTEHEVTSKANVQRWVGAHIIPTPDVNFTTSTPYDTLTPGATIAFSAISSQERHLIYEPMIDIDAAHLSSVKGKKACAHAGASNRRGSIYSPAGVDTDAAHLASIKGPPSSNHATRPTNIQGTAKQKPIWTQYELNDGVHVISEKKASNGVMYLIDGTVLV